MSSVDISTSLAISHEGFDQPINFSASSPRRMSNNCMRRTADGMSCFSDNETFVLATPSSSNSNKHPENSAENSAGCFNSKFFHNYGNIYTPANISRSLASRNILVDGCIPSCIDMSKYKKSVLRGFGPQSPNDQSRQGETVAEVQNMNSAFDTPLNWKHSASRESAAKSNSLHEDTPMPLRKRARVSFDPDGSRDGVSCSLETFRPFSEACDSHYEGSSVEKPSLAAVTPNSITSYTEKKNIVCDTLVEQFSSPSQGSRMTFLPISVEDRHREISLESDCSIEVDAAATDSKNSTIKQRGYNGIVLTGLSECLQYGIAQVTLEINSVNGPDVRYRKDNHLPIAFAAIDPVQSIGSIRDFRHALRMKGCDLSLISDKWIRNHARWIVWKLASIERRFPQFFALRCFFFNNVVDKMKHRFVREFVNGSRSPIRRILNRDVSAGRMMILCVSRIDYLKSHGCVDGQQKDFFVELTDGWYPVRAVLDARMTYFIREGRIRVGTKLLVSSAFLVGCDDGVDPLDDEYDTDTTTSSPALAIAANSCRLADWRAKLGFVPYSKQIKRNEGMLRVKSVLDLFDDGGKAPLMDFTVLKRNPILYLYRQNSTDSTTKNVHILSEAEEAERLLALEQARQDIADRFIDDIRKECSAVS